MVKPIPLVTVITPYRNAARWLPGLVENLQKQTYSHWECLIVDHGSTDQGSDFLSHSVADDPRFRCFAVPVPCDQHRPQGGPAVPRNLALTQASGELICFLDVDDLWHPSKLERQVQMHLRERLDLSVTAYYRWSWRTPNQMQWCCPPSRVTAWSWRWGNPIPMLTVMVNREVLLPFHRRVHFWPVHLRTTCFGCAWRVVLSALWLHSRGSCDSSSFPKQPYGEAMAHAFLDARGVSTCGVVRFDVLVFSLGMDHLSWRAVVSGTPGLGTLSIESRNHFGLSAAWPKGAVSAAPRMT